MAITAALKKLIKEEIIKITFDLQDNFSQNLKFVKKNLSELRDNVFKIETKLAVTKQINNVLRNQMVKVEWKSWSNEQYSRRECLEIVGIPESVTDSSFEETALNIFKELGVCIDASDIEACHRVGPQSRQKEIVKLFRRKDADRVWWVKKTLRV